MKTWLLSFIALVAVVVHATPTNNNRMESSQAIDSLDGHAHRRETTVSCVQCNGAPNPYCRKCPDLGFFKECWNNQKDTCAFGDAVPSNGVSCGKGYWGCIRDNCCKD